MPKSSKQLKVFLCHSSGDKSIVRELYEKLSSEGWIDPWLDTKKIMPGQEWEYEIEKAVEEADIILVFLTNASISKEGYIQHELRMVLDLADQKPEGTLFTIPVRLEDCDPPRRLRPWQYADYFPASNRSAAYKKLINSLKIRAKKQGISTNVQLKDQLEKQKVQVQDLEQKMKILVDTYADLRREGRYGMPTADQILLNRLYVIGYSYTFRQARWALEMVDPDSVDLHRWDNCRPDLRIPKEFRVDRTDYTGTGFDRGHLIATVDQREVELRNSDTLLLSNTSPQTKSTRRIWKELETSVRILHARANTVDTYVISGPIFRQGLTIQTIHSLGDKDVTLPIPHAFFKSVLVETYQGKLQIWSFVIPNESKEEPLEKFIVPTTKVEEYSNLVLWQRLVGTEFEKEKSKTRRMWKDG